jgi:hypothetical protein
MPQKWVSQREALEQAIRIESMPRYPMTSHNHAVSSNTSSATLKIAQFQNQSHALTLQIQELEEV